MLLGLVTKNAILLLDYANQAREHGMGLKEATLEACSLRLRPIFMTTLSTILGMMPIALGIGEGAELKYAILDKDVTVTPGAKLIGTRNNPVIVKRGETV